ncbi:hypothetical protein FACS1894133_7410 [Clostridia bacterium]|nr:hypothetical protein FACS1894133_7410 [Clostridia bacterium]
MAFGLKLRKVPKNDIKKLVEEAAQILDIQPLLDRKPRALSGGQRQRVALGRAIVRDPQVFLLDEPLSNLDAKLRAQMRTELAKLHKKLNATFVYVTHDQTEAMTMGDRIVVMRDGLIQQIDSPKNLYKHPVNKFVASFIGSPQMNFIDGVLLLLNGRFTLEFGSEDTKTTRGHKFYIELPKVVRNIDALTHYLNKDVIIGFRPEAITAEEEVVKHAETGVIDATVEVAEMTGAETYLYLNCVGIPITARASTNMGIRPLDEISLAIDPHEVYIFDANGDNTSIDV